MWQVIRENPRAVLYAVLMHIGLLILLVFSLDWTPKISRPAGIKVPIEATLIDQQKLEAIEERKQAEQRRLEEEQRQAELEAQRKAQEEARRKAEAEAERKAAAEQKRQAELAAQRKAEQEARRKTAEAEARRKAELEAKRKAEAEAEAKRKAAEARRKAELEAKRKAEAEAEAKRKAAAEAKRQAEEARRREAEQALQQQLAAEQAERDRGVVAEYTAYIQEKIQRNWLKPPGSPEGLSCTVQVSLIPGGDVARVQILTSSGDPVFDRSVETAVFKAAPLPLPPDSALFKYFRDLRLIFKPR
jgi:colicin import membrane protein